MSRTRKRAEPDSASPNLEAGGRRIGAIDVGTNSIRLTIAEVSPDGRCRVLDDEKETTRLGAGLATTGRIAPEAIERAVRTIGRMRQIAEGFRVESLRAIGTSAVREAANRDELLTRVEREAGVVVEPITADAEAQLAHRSVAAAFDLRSLAAAVVDIGGGSMEIVLSSGGVIEQLFSLPLGAVRLTEEFGGPDLAAGANYKRLRRTVRARLQRRLARLPFVPQAVIGTGGTFTALAAICLHRNHPIGSGGLPPVRGYELKRSDVRHVVNWLRAMPARDRVRVPGLSPDRADIIVAGLTVIERVLKHLGVNRLIVHDGGIRDGLLRTMAQAVYPQDTAGREPEIRMDSVRRFAAACSYEEQHCHHVAHLAGRIFDQLAAYFPDAAGTWGDPANRVLLEAAALLHDVGYLIAFARHYQHSYHLIVHADLAGFTPREIELIANIARYHGGPRPKKKHSNFGKLPRGDQRLVKHLAAILCLAEGLDRNHVQNVKGVTLQVRKQVARFVLDAPHDPEVDAWAAARKGKLFQRAFDLEPRFAWRPPDVPAAAVDETSSA